MTTSPPAATVALEACPICGARSFGVLGERSDGIAVLQCTNCQMGMVAEHPADTAAYYSDEYYAHGEASGHGYSDYALVAEHSLAWAVELVRLLAPGGKVLDVGSADGHLLQRLGAAYERYGIEVNDRLRKESKRLGIEMLGADVCDPRLPERYGGSFDVITAIAVLEHVAEIRTALTHLSALLAPDGVLLFEVPLLSTAGDNRVWLTTSLEHVYYPTLEGLAFLFAEVFGLPLIGREVEIRGYGSTFVGLATRSAAKHGELAAFLNHLLAAPLSNLTAPRERSFRFFFELVHAATPSPENVEILAEIDPAQVTPALLHRLAALWGADLERSHAAAHEAAAAVRAELKSTITGLAGTITSLEGTVAELERTTAELRHDLASEKNQAEAAASRASENEARRAERERYLLQEREEMREELRTIHSSRSFRLVERVWKARVSGRQRFRGALWRGARFGYRLLPLATRTRLRRGVLAWLSVPDDAPPDVAVAHLRDLTRRLTWRRARAAAGLLLKGDLAALKLHTNQLVRHSVNEKVRDAAITTPEAPFLCRRQEPWPASLPLLSIVIPCYDYGHFVAEAVDSVLAQTFQDSEILVVDGGSSAPSLAALEELERPRTRIYFRAGRHLVGDNRNFGISQARGKYVCCLDADDRLLPTYLEKALFLLETQDYDLVSTSIRCFGDRNEVYHLERFPALAGMMQGNQVATCAVFRKDLWERAGGYRDTGTGRDYIYEDWRLWVRFAALGARIANIVEESLFLYRVHSPQSWSRQNDLVPPIDRQREAVVELNRDVIDDEALRRSEENRRIKVRMEDAFVNLERGFAAAPEDDEPTLLIAMPFFVIGGAERLVSDVATHLAGRGFRIVLVTTEHVYSVYGDSTPWFERATAEIYQLPRFLEPGRWQEFIFYLLATRNVSLLWIIGSSVLYELLPKIKSAYPDLKVIDLLFNTVGHTASNRKYAEFFDRILVENREVAAWLLAAGERPEKVLQIVSGVDLEVYRPRDEPSTVLAGLGIAPGAFVAGCSGRLSEEKDPELFLEIARRCRHEPRLVFLMTGAGPLSEQVQQKIEKLALGESLRFLGQVDQVRDTMAAYDVLVLPSRFDGRPVAVLESLALGVPVIASRVGALPDLLQEGVTGFLCEPGDAEAFVERLRWLAAHPQEHRRMKAAARAFAESALDARQMFERYEAAIRGVMG
ncbi:MAG TPA: glycosyltransferase [Thermoanaerobaculia bacterium]|nr:glycosyltransferase [Thermoanaerobaculia bacterium]